MAATKRMEQSVITHRRSSLYWKLGLASALVMSGAIIAASEVPAQAATQEGKALTSQLEVETLTKPETLTKSAEMGQTNATKKKVKDWGGGRATNQYAVHTTLPSDYGEIQTLLAD